MTKSTITVCAECLTACCWNGIFVCDKARGAGTVEKTRAELRKLDREHPRYWRRTPAHARFQGGSRD